MRAQWDSFFNQTKHSAYYVPFVHALNVSDFKLEGGGVIDGQGACWWKANCRTRCSLKTVLSDTQAWR